MIAKIKLYLKRIIRALVSMSLYSIMGWMGGICVQWFGIYFLLFISLIFSVIYLIFDYALDLNINFPDFDIWDIWFHDITEKIFHFGGIIIGALISLYKTIKDPDGKIFD